MSDPKPTRNESIRPSVVLDGLTLPEGARWHDGELWFSDFFSCSVIRLRLDGSKQVVAHVPGRPSGLGWLPDGRLLIVSMTDLRLLRLDPEGLHVAADLAGLAAFHTNDMVVSREGRAYIGNCGFDYTAGEQPKTTVLAMVTSEGRASVVANDLMFPNGMAITPDGKTLIVAETFASRLTAFSIQSDGQLTHRRVWAQFEGTMPDGICLDAAGAAWVASPAEQQVLRVREGGEITARVHFDQQPTTCVLGGADRKTLFVLSSRLTLSPEQHLDSKCGRVEMVRVDVPGVA